MALLKKELEDVQGLFKTAQDRIAANDGAIRTWFTKLKDTENCRHCGEKFNGFFEKESLFEGRFMLRCKSCRTRHP